MDNGRRVDDGRGDLGHRNVQRRQLATQRLAQAVQRGLRGRIDRRAGRRRQTVAGADDHDRRAGGALEPGQEPADQMNRPVEVRTDLGREVEALQVLSGEVDLPQPAGVADQEVDPGVRGENVACEGLHRGAVGNVDRVTFDAGMLGFQPVELLRVAAARDDRVAPLPERRHERLADSRRSTAHHGDRRRRSLDLFSHGVSVSRVGAPSALFLNPRPKAPPDLKRAKRPPRAPPRLGLTSLWDPWGPSAKGLAPPSPRTQTHIDRGPS